MSIDHTIARAIAVEHYLAGEEQAEITEISEGVENHNYKVVTSQRAFVLRIYNQANSVTGPRTTASILKELDFMRLADKFGAPTPKVIPTNAGDLVAQWPVGDHSYHFAAFRFIEASATQVTYTSEILPGIAQVVEGLYRASVALAVPEGKKDMPHGIMSRSMARYAALRPLLAKPSRLLTLVDELHAEAKTEERKLLTHASAGFIHGDLKLENIMFANEDNSAVTAVLDFDDYRYSFRIEDLALLIMRDIGKPTKCLLQTGLMHDLLEMIELPEFKDEIAQYLEPLLRARLMYDLLKLLHEDKVALAEQILSDKHVRELISSHLKSLHIQP
ncbi:MAG: phosphotransferase [Candidatus Saccharibacteria bacterium]|nr:phosphotransferase [Candidatus Saccharibacteria bacterium]